MSPRALQQLLTSRAALYTLALLPDLLEQGLGSGAALT
jgi:hypothetical protein